MFSKISICPFVISAITLISTGNAFGQAKATQVARGDAYYLQRGQIDTEHANDHARLAEEYMAMSGLGEAAKDHARAIRTGVKSARQSHSMLSDVAKKDAEIAKKLASIAEREKQLLALADRIDPPVNITITRRPAMVVQEERVLPTRIQQSYYFHGEGHFID